MLHRLPPPLVFIAGGRDAVPGRPALLPGLPALLPGLPLLAIKTHTSCNSWQLDYAQKVQTSTKASNLNHKWCRIQIQISGLIWIPMSAGLLPKCCGFTTLSVPVIMLSAIKIGSDCMRNANKSPKSPYSAMVREVEKWSGICIQDPMINKSSSVLLTERPNHNTKFPWNWLITFAVMLHTDRMSDRMTNDLDCISSALAVWQR